MVDDPNRKTPRTFQCRDYLWESFETMSGELECSIDYLINEAMRHYLRAQGRTGPTRAGQNGGDRPSLANPPPASNGYGSLTGAIDSPRAQRLPTVPPGASAGAGRSAGSGPVRGPSFQGIAPPGSGSSGSMPQQRPPSSPAFAPAARTAPPVAQRTAPPPIVQQPQPRPAAQRVLHASCEGQDVPVTKEEFFIGRTQRMCDLVIRDTNISRQHARVVLHNGAWWIVDNQSTNGVEFHGAKIQQKRVEDGDVFTICGHDVQFRYQ